MPETPYTLLGTLTKLHGFEGAMVLSSTQYLPDEVADLSTIFLWIEGLPVPFFPESIELRTDFSAVILLEEVDRNQAEKWIGCEVSCLTQDLSPLDSEEEGLEKLMGYTVLTPEGENRGVISDMDDFNGNVVFRLSRDSHTYLVPFHYELVISMDEKAQTLKMNLPEGLLEEE